jgi:hypothetical protein
MHSIYFYFKVLLNFIKVILGIVGKVLLNFIKVILGIVGILFGSLLIIALIGFGSLLIIALIGSAFQNAFDYRNPLQKDLDSGKITEEQYCIETYGDSRQQNILGKCLKYFK